MTEPQSRYLAARYQEGAGVYLWYLDAKEADTFHASKCHVEFIPYKGKVFTVFCHESVPVPVDSNLRRAFVEAIAGKYQWNMPS